MCWFSSKSDPDILNLLILSVRIGCKVFFIRCSLKQYSVLSLRAHLCVWRLIASAFAIDHHTCTQIRS